MGCLVTAQPKKDWPLLSKARSKPEGSLLSLVCGAAANDMAGVIEKSKKDDEVKETKSSTLDCKCFSNGLFNYKSKCNCFLWEVTPTRSRSCDI